MQDVDEVDTPTRPRPARGLGPEALAALREVFAQDLPSRVTALRSPDPAQAGRAAHTVGSSAFLVDEPDLARAARAVEQLVLTGAPWTEDARLLAGRLEAWRP